MGPGHHMGMAEFGAGPLEGPGMFGGRIDREALLAEALGITVEELRQAQKLSGPGSLDSRSSGDYSRGAASGPR
jgi:hypothetical protein